MKSSVATMIGYGVNAASSLVDSALNRSYNEQQRDLEWQRMLQQWQRENAYNHPSAVTARMKAAGINPALAYMNGASFAPAAASPGSPETRSNGFGLKQQIDPYTAATIELMQAQADDYRANASKKRSEQTYQDFINDLNKQLENIPVGTVSVISSDGSEEVHTTYGNYHIIMKQNELRKLGLENSNLEQTYLDLAYNLAIMTGSDTFDNVYQSPSATPNWQSHQDALKGNNKVQEISGELAEIEKEAAEAEKAGVREYNEWLQANKDKPIVSLLLGIQGFVKTFFKGVSLPSVTISRRTIQRQ